MFFRYEVGKTPHMTFTISESIKMVNLLNQLQANCSCHTSPLMQRGCMTTFSHEKDDFSVKKHRLLGRLKNPHTCIPKRGPTYDVLVTIPDTLLLLLRCRRLVGVEGTTPGLCTVPKKQKHYFYEIQCTTYMYLEQMSMLTSPITAQYKLLSRTNLKSKSFHEMDVFFI